MTTPKTAAERRDELDEQYATRLQFLWEQYNKLMGLGVIASAVTVGFLLQGVLFNTGARAIIKSSPMPLNTGYLMGAIVTAALAAAFFVLSRWCSQILMERQVYGRFADAARYFDDTLENETIWPTALRTKKYLWRFERTKILALIGDSNEWLKFAAIGLIVLSWILGFRFAWPLFHTL